MFLKNYDMLKTYLITDTTVNRQFNEDKEIYLKSYKGEYIWLSKYLSDLYYSQNFIWRNGFFKDTPTNISNEQGYFLWPGGMCELNKRSPSPYISETHVKYDDFNLYQPFYGGNASGGAEDEIYGQNPTISGAIYNEQTDTWTKTVTREFKNISGYTIIIKELGVFSKDYIVARELLDEPIVVENEGYFKMSFTYECENPHEHRQEKRERLVIYPNFGNENPQDSLSVTPTQGDKILFSISVFEGDNRVSNASLKDKEITAPGWNIKLLHTHIKTWKKIKENELEESLENDTPSDTEKVLFKTYLLTKKPNAEDYKIILPGSSVYVPLGVKTYYYQYLDDDIANLEKIDFFDEDTRKIEIQKNSSDSNLIWVCSSSNIYSQNNNFPSFTVKSQNIDTLEKKEYCDSEIVFNNSAQTFIYFTESDSDNVSHIFEDYRNNDGINRISILKLKATINGNKPLWEDIPTTR